MSPEERELLNRSVSLAEDNNKILHAMRRSMRVSRIFNIIYWIFIIGSAIGAYYFIQPYLEKLYSIYDGAQNSLDSFNQTIDNFKK